MPLEWAASPYIEDCGEACAMPASSVMSDLESPKSATSSSSTSSEFGRERRQRFSAEVGRSLEVAAAAAVISLQTEREMSNVFLMGQGPDQRRPPRSRQACCFF
ncbi:unnamed protein product [Symbiodinium pilosum]|uniref:Uncharacterized protein n=1 Tax=Symbiodinium pilosum TaxID=2952 RepID=A0A812WK35_SYMPI|nr:unnamed protein product [Symbiodinium pilosum]